MDTKIKKPINKTLVRGCIAFIMLVCLILGVVSYLLFSNAFYTKDQEIMRNDINYIEDISDPDDLLNCVKTKKKSEKYKALQKSLNTAVADLGTEYIYIVIPNEPKKGIMTNVISATTPEEIKAGESDMPLLEQTDAYDIKQLDVYEQAKKTDEISYFDESSEYGRYYTACKPMRTSKGEFVALICVDISIDNMQWSVARYVTASIVVTIIISLLFMLFLISWIRRSVTDPVLKLERSTRHFAMQSNEGIDPTELYFDVPEINIENEVQSLSATIEQLSYDMKNYVESIVSAEERASSAEKEAKGMTRIAYQDALTRVKSKAAFDVEMKELNKMIHDGKESFAMVMMDLNELKKMNDEYGHDMGDKYLVGGCKQMCVIYKHSPIFRIGGDEFVAVLRGGDYENRNLLLSKIKSSFRESSDDMSRKPWERYSAAAGMAEHLPGDDETAQDVLKRADIEMYNDKKKIKAKG